ncbi:hypothetical protein IQ241_07750 [Romeria aff. gracilis LEGE 07310]|uniref:Uncharacterized protein n=1 Tax=Vasconcelosia minhoensis LEGE 07310 TaxID=915328 RepID=A0A8J7ACI6_9CYAN|nr:hypothetical protein [Romeria gracilis]MBE9077189.1 hypothetical protein [Romeria aff. gracilis LEGE 07310]
MTSFAKIRFSRVAALLGLASCALIGYPLTVNAQTPAETPDAEAAPETPAEATRPLDQAGSPLGIASGEVLMQEAEQAISVQDYPLAAQKLQSARESFNKISGFYQQLSGVFTGVDSRVNDSLRQRALTAAEMRDQATYQLALVYRAQSQPEQAVPLLVEVVQSQQPTRELGQQAYQQLFELGFVEFPYPRGGDSPSE